MSDAIDPIFNDNNKVKSLFIQWGKEGDWIKGTLVSKREVPSKFAGKEAEVQTLYEFKAHAGQFHQIDENKKVSDLPIVLTAGDFWTVGGKVSIDNQMRNVKLGQIVGMKFTEMKPSKTKGFASAKVIAVYAGAMDPDWQGESAADGLPDILKP